MKKARIITKRRISYILMAAVLMLCCLLFVSDSFKFYKEKYIKSDKAYTPMQYEIANYTKSVDSTNYLEMSDLYTINGATVSAKTGVSTSGYTILISTAQDLYAFSCLADANDSYLGYNYQLSANIDYTSYGYEFIPIAWEQFATFSGTFDGDGFEITGLDLLDLDATTDKIATTDYYAMFSKNSGTIKNIGLVNTEIVINLNNDGETISVSGVAPLCGLNTGTIENVYAIDLGVAADESGISAAGGYLISGLVSNNTNILKNAYTAYSIVSNYTITDLIGGYAHEILSTNSGTTENLYYYNAAIEKYTDGSTEKVEYDKGLIGKTFERIKIANSTYCASLDAIATSLNGIKDSNGDNIWYTKDSYNDASTKAAIGLETPILRGIKEDNINSKTLYVNSTKDFLYMFELMNSDAIFASSAYTYIITEDIDLSKLPSYTYAYDSYIGATIKGSENSSRQTLKDIKGDFSPYPTIYGASISNTVLTEGIECFGLFPYLTGTIQYLNFYYTDKVSSLTQVSEADINFKSVGLVSGYVEGGTIDNVNVSGDISFATSFGRHYAGGIAGILTEKGIISNCTTAGSINAGSGNTVYSNTQVTGYVNGNSIGGIVGYATSTNGDLTNALSAMDLTLASYASSNTLNQAVGGVLGAGYTSTADGLSNKGNITIGSATTNYGQVFAAGVIGRHIGLSKQVNNFYNQGDITVSSNANTNYISGVTNVDVLSTATDGLSASTLKNSNGKLSYWAASFTNASNITINGSNDVKTSGMVYINANNSNKNFASEISAFYNLAYRNVISNGSSVKQTLEAEEIDFSSISSYASCVVSTGVNENNIIDAETIYNLKDINFTTSENISNTNMNYSGVILGKYINLTDIRNEGKLSFTIDNATSNISNLSINGVFEELSSNCTASDIFNGGDISVIDNDADTKNLNMYISGICKANNSVITDTKYNPLNENFDNTTVGSLNNVINNGDISVTQTNLDRNTASNVLDPSVNLYSNIYAGGITYSNSGIISNTFNLGNVDIEIFSKQASNYYVGGISALNSGHYAQIRDCANNGDLFVIDMNDEILSRVFVGGIVSNNIDSGANINQVIAFTINYGTINSYQAMPQFNNTHITADTIVNIHSVAGGILAQGLCNMVNIVNYGNIYSSECSAGLAGVIELSKFNNTSVNIANTINYGRVLINPLYYNEGGIKRLSITEVKSLERVEWANYVKGTYTGSLITVFDFDSQSNVNVRYLINLFNEATTIAYNFNYPTLDDSIVATFITANSITDTFGGKTIKYAPLSNIEDELGNIGVFSEQFVFRKAINGINLDSNYVTDSYIGDFFQFVRFDKINEQLLKSMGWEKIAYADAAENLAKNLEALSVLIKNSSSSNLLTDAFTNNTWIENSDTTILESYIELSIDSKELDKNLESILNYILFDEVSKTDFTSSLKSELFTTIMTYYEEQEKEELNYYNLLNELLYPELVARIIAGDTSDLSSVQNAIETALRSSANLATIYEDYVNILSGEGEADSSVLDPLFDNDYYTQSKINLLNTLLEGYSDETLMVIYEQTKPSDAADELKYLMYLQNHTDVASQLYAGLISFNALNNANNTTYLNVINDNLKKYNVENYLTVNNIAALKNLYPTWDADGTIQDILKPSDRSVVKKLQTLTPTLSADIIATHDYTELWNIIKTDSNVQKYISTNYFNTYEDPTYGIATSGLLAKATEWNNSYQSNDKSQSYYGIAEDYRGGINYGGESATNDMPATNLPTGGSLGFTANGSIVTRFIYTPEAMVSSSTNYFGPYMSNGEVYSAGENLVNNNYNLGWDLSLTDTSSDMKRNMVPIFIGSSESITSTMIADAKSTNKNIYHFYWNNSNTDNDSANTMGNGDRSSDYHWKYNDFVDVAPDNTDGYMMKNYNTGEYIYDYYDFTPNRVNTRTLDFSTYTPIPGGQSIRMTSPVNKNPAQYRDHIFVGYCSSAKITGIFYSYSMWNHTASGSKLTSLIAKNEQAYAFGDSSGYFGVHTTDYIDYQIDDLVKLDGIRTKGKGSDSTKADQYHIKDNDEINIISAIVENMLANKNGQIAIMTAINNYFEGNSVTIDNYEAADMLLSSLTNTEFANEFVINSLGDIMDLQFDNTYTISTYLDSLGISLDSIKDEIIARATNDMSNFRKVILATDVICSKIEQYSTYEYDRTELNRLIYDYILDRYGTTNIDGESINTILSDSSDDLTYMDDIFILKEYLNDNYIKNGFTFTGDWLVNYLTSTATINEVQYNKNLIAEDDATISFNSSTNNRLKLVFKGRITINGTAYNNTNAAESIIELSTNTNYTITFNNSAEFYDISLAQVETTTTPYATITNNNLSWYSNSYYRLTYGNESSISLGAYDGWTMSLTIYARYSNNNYPASITYGDASWEETLSSSFDEYIVFDNVQLTQNDAIAIFNRNTTGNLRIQYLLFTFTKTLSDGTVITVTQRLQNNDYENNEINVDRNNSNLSLIYDENLNTEHSSSVEFELYKVPYSQFDLSSISSNYTKSLGRNFNSYYSNISDIGRYIIEDVIVPHDYATQITVTEPSFLIINASSANSNGTVSVNNGAIPASVSVTSTNNQYYSVYLPSLGTYTISSSNVTISNIYTANEDAKLNISGNTITNSNDEVLFNLNYAGLSGFNINTIINNNSLTTSQKYVIYMDSYLNYREDYSSNRSDDIFELITTVYGTITEVSNSQTYYTIFTDSVFTNSALRNVIELIILADDTAYATLIEQLDSGYYADLLKSITDSKIQTNIAERIVSIVKDDSSTYNKTYLYAMAAYLGNDYLNNINTLNSSIMYEILSDYSNGQYQFINNDNSINAERITALLEHLTEGNTSIDLGGYGIFALSSSKGILNGQFIPDNIALDSLDKKYTLNSTDNHWELSESTSANWRGGNESNKNYTDENNTDTVNYAVLKEMKQLKKSISTTIFTLDLITSEYTLYSSEELIDLENYVITYYVPTGTNLNNVRIDTNTLSIANLATMYLNKSTALTTSFNLKVGENAGLIKVEAEDTTIVAEYTIVIEEVDIESITLTLYPNNSDLDDYIYDPNSNATFGVPYVNGYICVYLTSNKLPMGLDIEPYLTITNSNGEVVGGYELDDPVFINDRGSGIINLIILDTMPYGEYSIKVSVLGVDSNELIFYKNPSTEKNITSFIYEGDDIVNSFVNNELTTEIPFGRCYDYVDLTDSSLSSFYLSGITVSPGATYTISATKLEDEETKKITYTVKYVVTAEDTTSKTYTHYLVEKDPLIDGNIANIYKNGAAVLDAILDDDTILLSFRRGEAAPSYKIKYNLTNFYTEGNYDYIAQAEYTGITCDARFSGITIEISDSADAGKYSYNYVFTNVGEWIVDPEAETPTYSEYTKEYTFPLITVDKQYAIDAELKRLTFLDSQLVLGAAYTVMYPDYSIRPGEAVSTNEVRYDKLKDGTTASPISVEAKTITYNNNSNEKTNFYAVGTLSNAELANYAPTFGIYEYSEIYQYTTLDKLQEYGVRENGSQTKIDYEVVNTDPTAEELYIYVPYIGNDGVEEIFLVQVIAGKWSNVYETSYTGTGNPIGAVTENKGSFEANGKTYTISSSAGTTSSDNKSLYMDYIGTPLQDHFWWVSYVVFSEDYMRNPSASNTNLKFYHVSLIDISNTIYFNFTFETPEEFKMSSVYLSIVDRVYDDNNVYTNTVNINAFASAVDGVYSLEYNLQVLPRGYFYFYLNLPEGYICEYEITNERKNTNENEAEVGGYLPPASIVTQKVDIKVTIKKLEDGENNQTIIWAESTSEVFSVQATEKQASQDTGTEAPAN